MTTTSLSTSTDPLRTWAGVILRTASTSSHLEVWTHESLVQVRRHAAGAVDHAGDSVHVHVFLHNRLYYNNQQGQSRSRNARHGLCQIAHSTLLLQVSPHQIQRIKRHAPRDRVERLCGHAGQLCDTFALPYRYDTFRPPPEPLGARMVNAITFSFEPHFLKRK